jgi:ABC-type Fe3+/spermidine/putrescine transport system ATPase subunit
MIMEGLEILNIHKSFENTSVLAGISFRQAKGEILAILGPSGSGKTTLLEVIAGLVQPESGDCLWDGISLLDIPTHERGFGLMFQEYVLFPHKDVGDNVAFGLKMAGEEKDTLNKRVNDVLDLVGLPGYNDRDVSTLSGGEQQRVALARSLAPAPRLVMLDEPLGALDRAIRERLVGELRTILKNANQTALYVTHDQEEAFSIADRIIILGNGKTAQIGTAREIYFRPKTPYVAKFLGMTNFLNCIVRRSGKGSEIETTLGKWLINDQIQGGGQVLLRPDKIHLDPAAVPGGSQFTGELISNIFSGSNHNIQVLIDGLVFKFTLSNPGNKIPEIGEPITIWFSPDEAFHFYSENSKGSNHRKLSDSNQ